MNFVNCHCYIVHVVIILLFFNFHLTACPADTYNPVEEPNICLPCGAHMSTEGNIAQVKEGCVCDFGWKGPDGGPCVGN